MVNEIKEIMDLKAEAEDDGIPNAPVVKKSELDFLLESSE